MATTISPAHLLEALNWRYATKQFDAAKKIPADLWATLEQTLVLAPSSFGLQPWKFVVVTDPALKAKLPAISWGQSQPQDCSHLVVFTVRKNLDANHVDRFLSRTVEVRGGARESLNGYRDMMLGSIAEAAKDGRLDAWQTNQVYIALGQFLTVAALLGVDACPMEGIDRLKYDEALGLVGSGYSTVAICAVGYRRSDDRYAKQAKVRFPSSEVILHR
jgi:nitroreductase